MENPSLELQEKGGEKLQNDNQFPVHPPPTYASAAYHDAQVSILPEGKALYSISEKEMMRLEMEKEKSAARAEWDTHFDSLLSVIGFAVDLANIWRFPYLCYRNGGGAFLIPYLLMLLLGGMPLLYLELIIGQYHRRGCIGVWNTLCPLFKGVGFASCLISYYVAFYYNIIISWAFYYFFSSFTANLPWVTCGNWWNTDDCWNGTLDNSSETGTRPTEEFFDRKVLGIYKSSGIEDLGGMKWDMTLCALLTFTFLFLALWKGVKTSGKVVYVTVLMPYIVLLILLIRGVMLEGAKEGIKYYLIPNAERLLHIEVWIDAAIQIFYSVGPGFGVHIAYASYNKFHNNVYRDMLITASVNSLTSFFSGFVIFSYLGYMASSQNVTIDKVASDGPGLVFVVYPEAIATLPGSTFWALIFFIMLLTLGLDSAMGGMESLLTGLQDELHWLLKRWKYSRQVFSFIIIYFAYIVGFSCVTYGGSYVVHLLDSFSAGTSILIAVFFETVAISWFYGIENLCRDVQTMMYFRPGIYWRICWKFLSPIFIFCIILASIIGYAPLTYEDYTYPKWANALGWLICLSSAILIPIHAVYKYLTTKGTPEQRLALCLTPENEHEVMQQTRVVKRFQARHYISI